MVTAATDTIAGAGAGAGAGQATGGRARPRQAGALAGETEPTPVRGGAAEVGWTGLRAAHADGHRELLEGTACGVNETAVLTAGSELKPPCAAEAIASPLADAAANAAASAANASAVFGGVKDGEVMRRSNSSGSKTPPSR